MKKTLIVLTLGCSTAIGYSQGQVNFNNFISGSFAAPIYGPEPVANGGDRTVLQGQGSANLSNPMGSTVYHGTPLAGTGFTAQLWGGAPGALAAPDVGTGTRSFSTVPALAGYLSSGVTAQFAGMAGGSVITLQVRAWDNRTGTITSWAQVLQDPTILRGLSGTFNSPALTTPPTPPPNMAPGMTSFNLFTTVPEPSVIGLGALALGGLLFRRIRK
jgi:hypothetical protein